MTTGRVLQLNGFECVAKPLLSLLARSGWLAGMIPTTCHESRMALPETNSFSTAIGSAAHHSAQLIGLRDKQSCRKVPEYCEGYLARARCETHY
jgi:hypothetical protein